jgi:glycosyltransferase involved in cell wall biosynthesis
MTDISVIIATYNRMELLPRTLAALGRQQAEGVEYELLFVDDGSTDQSREMLEAEARRSAGRIRYLSLPHSGSPSRPRNLGIREATGKVVLFLDDDVIPDSDLILNHWKFHQRNPRKELAALGELFLPPDAKSDPMSLFHSFPYDEVRRKDHLNYLFFWTCNLSLKREFMLEHGLFDEDPSLHPLEDMECGYRLCTHGLRLEFLPEARGAHVHKMNPAGVAQKGQRTGRAQFALSGKVSDVGLKDRFRILSSDLSTPAYIYRVMRRAIALAIDNRLTLAVLRGLGAERSKRNRITDMYYFLIFRRHVVAGYNAAKNEFQHQLGHSQGDVSECER